MSFSTYDSTYKQFGAMSLDDFLDAHGDDEIIECSDSMHAEILSPDELRRTTGGEADVSYLGENSEWWDGTDKLIFLVTPTEDGEPDANEAFEIAVVVLD